MSTEIQKFAEAHNLPVEQLSSLVSFISEHGGGLINADTVDSVIAEMIPKWQEAQVGMANDALRQFGKFADLMYEQVDLEVNGALNNGAGK